MPRQQQQPVRHSSRGEAQLGSDLPGTLPWQDQTTMGQHGVGASVTAAPAWPLNGGLACRPLASQATPAGLHCCTDHASHAQRRLLPEGHHPHCRISPAPPHPPASSVVLHITYTQEQLECCPAGQAGTGDRQGHTRMH